MKLANLHPQHLLTRRAGPHEGLTRWFEIEEENFDQVILSIADQLYHEMLPASCDEQVFLQHGKYGLVAAM